MDIKEFAKKINGREQGYPQFSEKEIRTAKRNGFVIVYGNSDDLIEFDGAIQDEYSCFGGGKISFGLDNENVIEALWCNESALDEKGNVIFWSYKTEILHETFMIYKYGESYCRGIVFCISDVK